MLETATARAARTGESQRLGPVAAIAAVLTKLEVTSRTEAARLAKAHGYLDG